MRRRVSVPAFLFLTTTASSPVLAQDSWRFGVGLSSFLGAESGREHDCDATSRLGLLQRIGRQVWGPRLVLEANLRAHILVASQKSCSYPVIPRFPRPDGTYFDEDHPTPLLTSPFTALDFRFRAAVPLSRGEATISVGAGHLWHDGGPYGVTGNKPFFAASAGFLIGSGPRWQVGVEGEVLSMSSAYWRSVTTWANGEPVSFEFLGTFRERLWATDLTLTTNLRF
jgi:hypothetical protein